MRYYHFVNTGLSFRTVSDKIQIGFEIKQVKNAYLFRHFFWAIFSRSTLTGIRERQAW